MAITLHSKSSQERVALCDFYHKICFMRPARWLSSKGTCCKTEDKKLNLKMPSELKESGIEGSVILNAQLTVESPN